jgi:hypothetical protein
MKLPKPMVACCSTTENVVDVDPVTAFATLSMDYGEKVVE